MTRAYRTKSDLSQSRTLLLDLFQQINFGRILDLHVRDGEPIWAPPPKVVRDIKLGAGARPSPEPDSGDFELKTHLVEFFQEIERIGNGKVSKIELRFGLPVHMTVEERAGKSLEHCGAGDDGI